MSVALLDVNVLIALIDPEHINHEDAHRWFAKQRKAGWATCLLTINGCVRILSNPSYPAVGATPAGIVALMSKMCSLPGHQFWSDSVSLLDDRVFRPEVIKGHNQITDVYLLALAIHHRGKLATFDRSIPWKAVLGAKAEHLVLIGSE
jgi:uncharacterized protein